MSRVSQLRWMLLIAANVAIWCVLSLQQSHGANGQRTPAGATIADQQRAEIIAQLREIKVGVNTLVQYRRTGALPEADPLQP